MIFKAAPGGEYDSLSLMDVLGAVHTFAPPG